MKTFNSINEIGYEDWLEYETMASVECDVSNRRRMSISAVFFALLGAGAIAGAVLLGGGAAVALGVLAGCCLLTSGLTTFVGFGSADDETQPIPTKEEYAKAKVGFKELKRIHQWKKYDKLMREYWSSQKYRDDRETYLQAQQQNTTSSVNTTSCAKASNKVITRNSQNIEEDETYKL